MGAWQISFYEVLFMKVVVAIDSFKGSLSSFQAGTAVKEGILSALPSATVDVCPIADGGEGTVDAILQSTDASVRRISVTGPLGRSISAYYGILNGVAVMEMAKASGLPLLRANERNPMNTTTYGVGEMIHDAIRHGCREFIIGIGGGSPLDASKAIAIYASNPCLSPADIYLRKYDNKALSVVLVGTTSGTGSEVTGVSVLTDSSVNLKKSISGHDCYSVISFCDYTYTMTMPYSVTVSTALDAFAHAVEGYFSSTANGLSDVYAEKAFGMLRTGLLHFFNNKTKPDESLREELYMASLVAGYRL